MTALPKPRGLLSEQVLAGLADLPRPPASACPSNPSPTTTPRSRCGPCTSCRTAGSTRSTTAAERDPELFRVRCRLEDDLERPAPRGAGPGRPDGADLDDRLLRLGRRARRPVAGPVRADRGDRGAGARPAAGALGLPPQGGRPDVLGRSRGWPGAQGGPGRAAVRRVRRRRPAPAARRTCSRAGMEASGLRPEYGAYVDEAPVEVLEQNNALSMFGLQRRLRGAARRPPGGLRGDQLAAVAPDGTGARAAGLPRGDGRLLHRARRGRRRARAGGAARRSACGWWSAEPTLEPDVWFGAWTCLDLEDRAARRLLDLVGRGRVSAERADVVLCPGGPMLLRGDHVVVDDEGGEHRTSRPVCAVCRCGKSASKPWCDGTHKLLPQKLRPSSRVAGRPGPARRARTRAPRPPAGRRTSATSRDRRRPTWSGPTCSTAEPPATRCRSITSQARAHQVQAVRAAVDRGDRVLGEPGHRRRAGPRAGRR